MITRNSQSANPDGETRTVLIGEVTDRLGSSELTHTQRHGSSPQHHPLPDLVLRGDLAQMVIATFSTPSLWLAKRS